MRRRRFADRPGERAERLGHLPRHLPTERRIEDLVRRKRHKRTLGQRLLHHHFGVQTPANAELCRIDKSMA